MKANSVRRQVRAGTVTINNRFSLRSVNWAGSGLHDSAVLPPNSELSGNGIWLLSAMSVFLDGFDLFIVAIAMPLRKRIWWRPVSRVIGIDRISGSGRPPRVSRGRLCFAPAGTPVPTRTAKSSASHPNRLFNDLDQYNPISIQLLRIGIVFRPLECLGLPSQGFSCSRSVQARTAGGSCWWPTRLQQEWCSCSASEFLKAQGGAYVKAKSRKQRSMRLIGARLSILGHD